MRLDLLVDALLEDGEEVSLEPCVVSADPRLLRVAVLNVLRNARTHGRGIREVRVDAGTLEVHDAGPGFDGAPPGLSQPFVKGASSDGVGLGLALVSRIVAAHGGTLEFGPGPRVFIGLRSSRSDLR